MNYLNIIDILKLGFIWIFLIGTIRSSNEKNSLKIVLHSGLGGRSHVKGALEISQVLASRGHQITYASFDNNLPFADGYNVSKESLGPQLFTDSELKDLFVKSMGDSKVAPDTLTAMMGLIEATIEKDYTETASKLAKYLDNNRPDILVCDFGSDACMDLAKVLSLPLVIYIQSTDFFNMIPSSHVIQSLDYGPITIENMSFIERFKAVLIQPLIDYFKIKKVKEGKNAMRLNFGAPLTSDMFSGLNYGLGIANTFVGFEPSLPTPPNIVQIGPIFSKTSKELDIDLKEFLDIHQRVVFVGFGSNLALNQNDIALLLKAVVNSLEKDLIDGVIWGLGRTLSKDFPDTIKFNNSTLHTIDLINNINSSIRILNWAPQQSILKHPHTKLFVSHGGLESSLEAILSGTPILCIPYLGDQPRNAAKLESSGISLYIDRKTMDTKILEDRMTILIEDKEGYFKSNTTRMQVIAKYNSKRLEQAADLVEMQAIIAMECRKTQPYIVKSNLPPCEVAHLIPVGNRLNWVVKNFIDIYSIAALLLLLSLMIIAYVFSFVSSIFFGKEKSILSQTKLKNK